MKNELDEEWYLLSEQMAFENKQELSFWLFSIFSQTVSYCPFKGSLPWSPRESYQQLRYCFSRTVPHESVAARQVKLTVAFLWSGVHIVVLPVPSYSQHVIATNLWTDLSCFLQEQKDTQEVWTQMASGLKCFSESIERCEFWKDTLWCMWCMWCIVIPLTVSWIAQSWTCFLTPPK